MAITTEELLGTLGIEGVENIEAFKESFSKTFVSKQLASEDDEIKSRHIGKFTGIIQNSIKKSFGLENKEIEGKKVEEIIELAANSHRLKISELETRIAQTKDEVVAEWQTKAEKYKSDSTSYKEQNEGLQKALEENSTRFESEKRGWVINQKYGDIYKEATASFSEETKSDLLKIEGYNSLISKKYKFELDENSELSVFDIEGKRIQNPNKLGAFMTAKEVLLREATDNKMVKMNNAREIVTQTFVAKKEIPQEQSAMLHPGLAKFKR